MKQILFLSVALAMLNSCGKHTDPKALDLQDDDGDQILNFLETSEFDKYVANFQQISSKKGFLEAKIKTTSGDIKVIEGEVHFHKNIREEMIKHSFRFFESYMIHYDSDYFSEFALATIQGINKKINHNEIADKDSELKIDFESDEMNNDFISIMKKENGSYKEITVGQVQGKSLLIKNISGQSLYQEILNGNEIFFINNSKFKKSSIFFEKTLSEDMKNKTYRFVISTQKETNIYYVSTALSIQAFLDLAKIDLSDYSFRDGKEYISLHGESKHLDDRKLLIPLNFHPSSMNAKLTPGMTYGLYVNSVKNLKEDYFKPLSTSSGKKQRSFTIEAQGFEINFKKNKFNELIIDFNIDKAVYDIIESRKQGTYRSGGGFGNELYSCTTVMVEYGQIRWAEMSDQSLNDLGLKFSLDGKNVVPSEEFHYKKDGKTIKRMIFKQTGENLIAHFSSAAMNVKLGCLNDECQGRRLISNQYYYGPCQLHDSINEASLSVSYQAYIE